MILILHLNSRVLTHQQLIYSLFPDLFGTVIPSAFKNIGKLEMDGIFTKNDDIILSNANIKTEFGVIDYDIKLSNLRNINIAKYQGVLMAIVLI